MDTVKGRTECPHCRRSVKFFCYHCLWLVGELEGKLPTVSLPRPLTVLMDHRELDGKSTAVHAHFLTPPGHCRICKVDPKGHPDDIRAVVSELAKTAGKIALLFPDDSARTADQFDWSEISSIVAIDGTWSQAKAINRVLSNISEPALRAQIVWVRLKGNVETRFWRYQRLGPHCLSTIEAIAALYTEAFPGGDFGGLLCMFEHFYGLIQRDYRDHPERPFTRRHRSDYLQQE